MEDVAKRPYSYFSSTVFIHINDRKYVRPCQDFFWKFDLLFTVDNFFFVRIRQYLVQCVLPFGFVLFRCTRDTFIFFQGLFFNLLHNGMVLLYKNLETPIDHEMSAVQKTSLLHLVTEVYVMYQLL